MFQAVVDPVAGNLALSALVACIPLAAFFIMLVGVKAKAHVSAAIALFVAFLVAVFACTSCIPLWLARRLLRRIPYRIHHYHGSLVL